MFVVFIFLFEQKMGVGCLLSGVESEMCMRERFGGGVFFGGYGAGSVGGVSFGGCEG